MRLPSEGKSFTDGSSSGPRDRHPRPDPHELEVPDKSKPKAQTPHNITRSSVGQTTPRTKPQPEGPKTTQPQATPREPHQHETPALKGNAVNEFSASNDERRATWLAASDNQCIFSQSPLNKARWLPTESSLVREASPEKGGTTQMSPFMPIPDDQQPVETDRKMITDQWLITAPYQSSSCRTSAGIFVCHQLLAGGIATHPSTFSAGLQPASPSGPSAPQVVSDNPHQLSPLLPLPFFPKPALWTRLRRAYSSPSQ